MPILREFERRLGNLVEGFFASTFRSGLQPVELAKRVMREMDAGKTVGVRDVWAPNHFIFGLSEEDRRTLAELRQSIAPMPPRAVAAVVQQELGKPPRELFRRWSPAPLASASIGQVHRAELSSGAPATSEMRPVRLAPVAQPASSRAPASRGPTRKDCPRR